LKEKTKVITFIQLNEINRIWEEERECVCLCENEWEREYVYCGLLIGREKLQDDDKHWRAVSPVQNSFENSLQCVGQIQRHSVQQLSIHSMQNISHVTLLMLTSVYRTKDKIKVLLNQVFDTWKVLRFIPLTRSRSR
jgi:hypothetical protein